MTDNPYQKFKRDSLILRDFLAADRTILANERTFLAYIRTALALIVLGVTSWHFLETEFFKYTGIASIILGILVFIIGLVRYNYMNKKIAKFK